MNLVADEADLLERCFEVEGLHGHIKIVTHPDGTRMMIEISAKGILSPAFIEAALYDVANKIAHEHGRLLTMAKIKEENWN